MDIKKKKTELD